MLAYWNNKYFDHIEHILSQLFVDEIKSFLNFFTSDWYR